MVTGDEPTAKGSVRAGVIGAAVLLVALLGVLLWMSLLMSPIRLATGLLDARDHLSSAQKKLARGRVQPARLDILAGVAAARRARAGLESGAFMDLASALPRVGPILDQADHLVAAAELSAGAARDTVELFDTALSGPDSIIQKVPGEQDGVIRVDRVRELAATADGIARMIEGARRELEAIHLPDLPRRLRGSVLDGINDAGASQKLLVDAQRGLDLLPAILGETEPRTYIVGMLNPAELRGSGGSFLQYAMLTVDNGRLRLQGPNSVYKIDRGRQQIDLPLPEDAWYLSGIPDARRFGNANWSPHWPLSAQLTIDYARAREPDLPDIDGFISMTPAVLKNLVQSTGPFVTKWGHEISRQTAVPFLLHDAYGQYPEPSVRRTALKQVVNGFFRRVLQPRNPLPLVQGLARGLSDKDVQIWMAAEPEQSFIKQMRWDGAVRRPGNDDYLAVVQQNVGGNKLDYYAELSTDMTISFDESDALVSTLVEISNGVYLPQADWAMGNSGPLHRPMVNVYVRDDAVIEEASVTPETCPQCPGFLVGNKRTGENPAPALGRLDSPEPAVWIGGFPPEHLEAGKKVWSATLQIPPQQSARFELRYRSPQVLQQKNGRTIYRLSLQHQPKVHEDQVRVSVQLPEGVEAIRTKSELPFQRRGDVLIWEHAMNRDVELEVSWRS